MVKIVPPMLHPWPVVVILGMSQIVGLISSLCVYRICECQIVTSRVCVVCYVCVCIEYVECRFS